MDTKCLLLSSLIFFLLLFFTTALVFRCRALEEKLRMQNLHLNHVDSEHLKSRMMIYNLQEQLDRIKK